MVDKYQWVDIGSSYLLSDLQAAYLWGQLEYVKQINNARLSAWDYYYQHIKALAEKNSLALGEIPEDCTHNAHMFYLKTSGLEKRSALLAHLKKRKILAVFHYVPLHTARVGRLFGRFHGKDRYTTCESERLIRLPLWYGVDPTTQDRVLEAISEFYS